MLASERSKRARAKEPAIEVNQRWIAYVDGKVFRRIRILAPHPDGGWIHINEPVKGRTWDLLTMGRVPEFNLRYVFELEEPHAR